jgi:hypothetical protein
MDYHPIITALLNEGVGMETVTLLLVLPVAATLIALFRQVIGIKAFGIYTPLIIAFAFLAFDPKGLKYGIVLFVAVISIGMATRYIMRRFRLLYLPRVAITLSVVALVILGALALGGHYQRTGFANLDIVPLLVVVALSEKFIAAQIEKGSRIALILALETLVISVVVYLVISSAFLTGYLLRYPWLILLTFAINIWLGRFTGLRLTEYVRFRKVFKYL